MGFGNIDTFDVHMRQVAVKQLLDTVPPQVPIFA